MLIIFTFVSLIAGATKVIDARRVYNPELNDCGPAIHEALPREGFLDQNSSAEELKVVETAFLNWLTDDQCPGYMREFDTSLFHYQFIESKYMGQNKTGVMIILPEKNIRPEFYTQLGSGLEIPGARCVSSHCSWINDGEIFSCIVDRETQQVEQFKNWRFEQEYENFDPVMAYYSLLSIHYKCKDDQAEETTIVQFVDGEFRTEIPAWENYPVMLPKGKVSVLVFYCKNQVKGVLCFDMTHISKMCPMSFESTVYMKERLGYERILYAQPKCEGIYGVSILPRIKFEEISSMTWEALTDFKHDLAIN